MNLWLIFGLSGISGWLYRRGGTSAGTLWRDWGVPICNILTLFLLGYFHTKFLLSYFLVFLLSWGALSTYIYFLPKTPDKKWFHYALHGFFVGLAMIPFAWASGLWTVLFIRTFVLSLGTMLWSELIGDDFLEEFGRGFLINITLLFFL